MRSEAWHRPCFLLPAGSSVHMAVLVWKEHSIPRLSVCVACHLSLLPGHCTWGSDPAVLRVVGASFQASPHSDFPVFHQFHVTSKSLGPMRSALMCLGKQEPRLSFSDVVQSLLHLSPSAPGLSLLLLRPVLFHNIFLPVWCCDRRCSVGTGMAYSGDWGI